MVSLWWMELQWRCLILLSCKMMSYNPNTIKSYKILQILSPKYATRGVAQSPYPIYRHGKACLSKQPPWRAAGDPPLARGRSRVRAPGPAGALHTLFFSILPSFLLSFFCTFPTKPVKVLGLIITIYGFYILFNTIEIHRSRDRIPQGSELFILSFMHAHFTKASFFIYIISLELVTFTGSVYVLGCLKKS